VRGSELVVGAVAPIKRPCGTAINVTLPTSAKAGQMWGTVEMKVFMV
jgi:hypothetical protein